MLASANLSAMSPLQMSWLRAAAIALLSAACTSAPGQVVAPLAVDAPPAEPSRIDALLAQMTIEEKVGQLTQWGAQVMPTGPVVRQGGEDDIRQGRVGSILGAHGVDATRRLQELAVEQSRLKVPL